MTANKIPSPPQTITIATIARKRATSWNEFPSDPELRDEADGLGVGEVACTTETIAVTSTAAKASLPAAPASACNVEVKVPSSTAIASASPTDSAAAEDVV